MDSTIREREGEHPVMLTCLYRTVCEEEKHLYIASIFGYDVDPVVLSPLRQIQNVLIPLYFQWSARHPARNLQNKGHFYDFAQVQYTRFQRAPIRLLFMIGCMIGLLWSTKKDNSRVRWAMDKKYYSAVAVIPPSSHCWPDIFLLH